MHSSWIIIPLAAAFISWLIHRVAITLLLAPHRQRLLAEKLGALATRELDLFTTLEDKITHPANLQKLMPEVEKHIDEFLRHKLGTAIPMIGAFIGDKTISKLKAVFMEELEQLFPQVMRQYAGQLKEELDPGRLIAEKLHSLPPARLQQVLKKELLLAQLFGAALGFVLGVVCVALTNLLR